MRPAGDVNPLEELLARRIRTQGPLTVAEFMAEYIDMPPVNLPAIEFDFERDGPERIEELADQLREFWNVGFGPITDLAPLLEYNGIIVVEEPVNCDDMDAVSRWQGGRPYMLYAADQESNSRKLFNLAHELAHLVLQAQDLASWRALACLAVVAHGRLRPCPPPVCSARRRPGA